MTKQAPDQSARNQLIAQQFGLDEELIYLNHAALGPWPEVTVRAMHEFTRQVSKRGCSDVEIWKRTEREARQAFAALINAPSAADISLLKNTSEALSTIANGIAWRRGDNIVLPTEEFPSNRMMWDQLAGKGVVIRHVKTHGEADPESRLLDCVDQRTRVVTVSAVHYGNGLRLDVQRLGRELAGHDCLFCIDAIQQLGAVPLDVQLCHADVVACGVHKWLLAPEGTAMLYTRAERRAEISMSQWGWRALARPLDLAPDRWQIAKDARRYESGSHNTLGLTGTTASINLLLTIGIEHIAEHLWSLGDQLIAGFESMGHIVATPQERARRAGIIAIKLPHPNRVVKQMAAQNVVLAARDRLLRIAPHIHNRPAQLDQLLSVLGAMKSAS
ncbi:MAG: hypothetical protein DHS20C11_06110 [Lysobacteraceae bacterium]|nr:MAG: hypothetical protein DHS20C11_06110 [Xanthomonadaceae bacterium]